MNSVTSHVMSNPGSECCGSGKDRQADAGHGWHRKQV